MDNLKDLHEVFSQRITKLIESNGTNQRNFAISLGLNNGTVSRWMNGIRLPNIEYLIDIHNKYHVSIDWLVGLGDDITSKLNPELQELVDLFNIAKPEDKKVIMTILERYKGENDG